MRREKYARAMPLKPKRLANDVVRQALVLIGVSSGPYCQKFGAAMRLPFVLRERAARVAECLLSGTIGDARGEAAGQWR